MVRSRVAALPVACDLRDLRRLVGESSRALSSQNWTRTRRKPFLYCIPMLPRVDSAALCHQVEAPYRKAGGQLSTGVESMLRPKDFRAAAAIATERLPSSCERHDGAKREEVDDLEAVGPIGRLSHCGLHYRV